MPADDPATDHPAGDPAGGDIVAWLLAGDPAVSWQVRRDLLDDPARAERARARIATEGWGRRLLDHQDPEGTWAGALYSPKWISTTYTLLDLLHFGIPPNAATQRGVQVLIDGARWDGGGMTFAKTIAAPETCISGMLVALGAGFEVADERLDHLTQWLLDEQMSDGGWNCETRRSGATHASFHTSITVLEALTLRREAHPDPHIDEVIHRGQRFFLDHRLYHSHRTGAVVDPVFTRFSFPPRWHFDALRGLEHFRAAGTRDEQLEEAIELVRRRRRRDGRWPLQHPHAGRTWFVMEPGGAPSRWNTLRALRVLRWWDAAVESAA